MTLSQLREEINDFTSMGLLTQISMIMIYELEFDIDFYREFKDKIDPYELYKVVEEHWLKATSYCNWNEMKLWSDRLNKIRELFK